MVTDEFEAAESLPYATVTAVKKLPGKHTVYDIQVADRHRFYANGLLVHNCLGLYHPHGDSACYGAIVKMANTNVPVPLIDGEGNWGSLSDSSNAAMRYTEARLSKFADNVLFNKFYTPVIDLAPNYDSSTTEPVLLPALLPIVFINGRFGMAPGTITNIPSFTLKSVLAALKKVYEDKELTPEMFETTLKARSLYGGLERPAKGEARKLRRDMFKSLKGQVTLYSNPEFNEKNGSIVVTRFAKTKMDTMLERIGAIPGVKAVRDDSSTSDKFGKLTVVLGRGAEKDKVLAKVDELLSDIDRYVLNFTERYKDEAGQAKARMRPMSVFEAFKQWVAWRIELEQKACTYWINSAAEEIRKLELLILAVDNRKVIIESLDKDLDQDALEDWLAKKLGIKKAEAHFIYQLRVIQLRKLEKKTLMVQKAEVEKRKSGLEKRRKSPMPFLAKQLGELCPS